MARKRGRKLVEKDVPSTSNAAELPIQDMEVERQCAAIRAIRDVNIEHSLTSLRLLRSSFNEEQLKTLASDFFKANLPNLATLRNAQNGELELKLNNEGDGRRDINASLLRHLSNAHLDCSAIPPLGGFEFSGDTVNTSFFGADNLQIRDFLLEGPSESQMLGLQDSLQTPGVSSQRLSIGTTPKTLRLPKRGEMLLSVHGSPLGVYKDDNMEAIHESEEG